MKQTAVEWLIEQLENHNGVTRNAFENVIQQAKAMEKEQIMDAWLVDGYTDISNDYWKKEFEQYYNETFKS